MARKFLNKKVTTTTVHGFKLGEDGSPVPSEILLAGKYSKEKAAKEVRKNHDENFMVTSVTLGEAFYKVALDDFIKFAVALNADGAKDVVDGAETIVDDAAEKAPAEAPVTPAKTTKK